MVKSDLQNFMGTWLISLAVGFFVGLFVIFNNPYFEYIFKPAYIITLLIQVRMGYYAFKIFRGG